MRLRERQRLQALARSGERIGDPHDEEIVRSYIEYQDWFVGTWGGRFLLVVGPWIVLPTSLGLIVYWARQDQELHAAFWVALTIANVVSFRLFRSRRRSLQRTAHENGWEDSD
jgi:uncharacterized iron-regulated membrane protein